MKNIKTAALLGIAAAAGYGIYKMLQNEKVQATAYTVAGNTASAAKESGMHIADGFKSVVNKEVSGVEAVKETAKNIKATVVENYKDCKETLEVIYDLDDIDECDIEGMDEDDTEGEEIDLDELDNIMECIEADLSEDDTISDIGDIEEEIAEEASIFDDMEEQIEEETILDMIDDAEIDVTVAEDILDLGADLIEAEADLDEITVDMEEDMHNLAKELGVEIETEIAEADPNQINLFDAEE